MAFDANGNWVPSSNFNMGNMSQWGQTNPNALSLNPVVSGTGSVFTPNINAGAPVIGSGLSNAAIQQQYGLNKATGLDASSAIRSGDGFSLDSLGGLEGIGSVLGGVGNLAQSWLGFQGLGLAKDQLTFQRDAWNQKFALQKEEYEYQKQRRDERQANYDAAYGGQRNAASNASV